MPTLPRPSCSARGQLSHGTILLTIYRINKSDIDILALTFKYRLCCNKPCCSCSDLSIRAHWFVLAVTPAHLPAPMIRTSNILSGRNLTSTEESEVPKKNEENYHHMRAIESPRIAHLAATIQTSWRPTREAWPGSGIRAVITAANVQTLSAPD